MKGGENMSLRIQVNQSDEVAVDNLDGGGNPNYVETVDGTPANPWGTYTIGELNGLYYTGAASVSLIMQDSQSIRTTFAPTTSLNTFISIGSVDDDYIGVKFLTASSSITQEIDLFCFYDSETDTWTPDISIFPAEEIFTRTILTIVHHPLPT